MSTVPVVQARKKPTTLDKIRSYYLKGEHSVNLTPAQDKIRLKIYKAWHLMANYHSKEQAVKVLCSDPDDEKQISRAQAYRYINDALSLFGDIFKNHKEAKRHLIEEDLIRLQQRAIKDKDGYLEAKVLALRIKLGGFDRDDDPKFDPEKLKAQTYVLKLHPEVMKVIESSSFGGSVDFNSMDVEDVPFQEVNDDDEE